MDTLKASSTFNASIQIFNYPIHNANDFVRFSNNTFNNTYM